MAIRDRVAALALAALLASGGARLARADSAGSWWDERDATGDWNGSRRWLDERGVHIDLDVTADTFLGAGTPSLSAAYRGTVDLVLALDTTKLALWPGGTLLVDAQNGHGRGVSPELQTVMNVSNLEAPPFTQLSELWYEQRGAGDALRLRLGKQDANRDFAAPRFPGNFIHSSFGAPPTVPMPSFPAPGWGGLVAFEPQPGLSVRSGLYEGRQRLGSFAGPDLKHGAFFIAAAIVRHALGSDPEGAVYSAGAWHQTAGAADAEGEPASNTGGFALVDLLFPVDDATSRDREAPGRDARTVQLFARTGWARPERSPIDLYVGGGATYHGLRGADTLGLGGGHARFRQGTGPARSEEFIELFYKLRFAAWLTLEPDAQLIVHPGGVARAALVAGTRFKIKL
jgi:porin